MFKYLSPTFKYAILKLFNLVLSVGNSPDIWKDGLMALIFKNRDKLDPNNYRGICVNSNLGRLLCSITNSRLISFLTKHNVFVQRSIGILPNHSTSGRIYTLTEKHV